MQSLNRGFSMLEVLVALVISLVSLMGAAGLVVRTVQQEVESTQRVQALSLAQDMFDRINVNRQVVGCYTGVDVGTGVTATSFPCGSSAAQDRAEADLLAWHNALRGTGEQSGSTNIGAMIGARGCIDVVNSAQRIYRISVAWQGMSATVAPATNLDCGSGQYGADDKVRRVIAITLHMADLS